MHLALNQKVAGSIPVPGAVAVLYWFRNLAVNQVHVGSIPIGHPVSLYALESIWWWNLIVDQFATSSILVKGALHYWKTSGWMRKPS